MAFKGGRFFKDVDRLVSNGLIPKMESITSRGMCPQASRGKKYLRQINDRRPCSVPDFSQALEEAGGEVVGRASEAGRFFRACTSCNRGSHAVSRHGRGNACSRSLICNKFLKELTAAIRQRQTPCYHRGTRGRHRPYHRYISEHVFLRPNVPTAVDFSYMVNATHVPPPEPL